VACSNLKGKGFTWAAMYPNIVSSNQVSKWGSPGCGKCFEIKIGGSQVFVTAVDKAATWDLPTETLQKLGKSTGQNPMEYREVATSKCPGNKR